MEEDSRFYRLASSPAAVPSSTVKVSGSGGPTSTSSSSSSFGISSPTTSVSTSGFIDDSTRLHRQRRKSGPLEPMKRNSSGTPSPTTAAGISHILPIPRSSGTNRGSPSALSPRSPSSPALVPRLSPSLAALPATAFCTATSDHESLSVVTLGGLTSSAAVKEKILGKLHVEDDEFFACSFYLTRIGGGEGRKISDDELWELCSRSGDAGVVIYVKRGPHAAEAPFVAQSAQALRYSNLSPTPSSSHSPHHSSSSSSIPRPKASSPHARSDFPFHHPSAPAESDYISAGVVAHQQYHREAGGHHASPNLRSDGGWGRTSGNYERASPPLDRSNYASGSGGGGSGVRDRAGTVTPLSAANHAAAEEYQQRTLRQDAAVNRRAASGYSPPIGGPSNYHGRIPVVPQHPQPHHGRMIPDSNDPRSHAQFASPSPSQYHNLYVQGYQPPQQVQLPLPAGYSSQHHSPNMSTQSIPQQQSRSPQGSRSVDNLRHQYTHEMRNAPPLPPSIPPQYRSVSGGSSSSSTHPNVLVKVRPPSTIPPQSMYYGQQQQPSFAPVYASRPPQPPSHYPSSSQYVSSSSTQSNQLPFDPRIMRPEGRRPSPPYPGGPSVSTPPHSHLRQRSRSPNRLPPSSDQFRYSPSMQQQSFPPRRPSAHDLPPMLRSSQPSSSSPYIDHYAPPPLSSPRVPAHINLRPGETLQQVVRRGAADAPAPEVLSSARPPIAAYMRASDPSVEARRAASHGGMTATDPTRYSSESVPRRLSGEMNRSLVERERERERKDKEKKASRSGTSSIVEAGVYSTRSPNLEEPPLSSRSSGSSFTSLRSSPHVRRRSNDSEDYVSHRASSSSARSSTASLSTPATERNSLVMSAAAIPFEEFEDDVENESGTWLRQPTPLVTPLSSPIPLATLPKSSSIEASDSASKRSSLPPLATNLAPSLDTEIGGTLHAGDWSTFLINPFSSIDAGGDGEGTLLVNAHLPHDHQTSIYSPVERPVSPMSAPPEANKRFLSEEEVDNESRFYRDHPTIKMEEDSTSYSDEEGGTWLVLPTASSATSNSTTPIPTSTPVPTLPADEEKISSTGKVPFHEDISLSPRKEQRPSLRVTIDTPPTLPIGTAISSIPESPPIGTGISPETAKATAPHASSSSAISSTTAQSRDPQSAQLSSLTPSFLESPPIVRRESFAHREAESDWAFRPPVETVLKHLDEFFPELDVDKPVLDAASPPAILSPVISPSATSSTERPFTKRSQPLIVNPATATATTTASAATPIPAPSILKYKKSIRKVALDRTKRMTMTSTRPSTAEDEREEASMRAAGLLRRKSTKLWGTKVEEVTPAQHRSMSTAIAEHPLESDAIENFSFKWVKGELIGRGTFGQVYLALNVTNGEMLAVKQVELPKTRSDKDDARQQGMVASLKAEIELLKDLDHPKIVQYLGFEESISHLSIFLEYVPGGSVGRIIQVHGKFEENVNKSFTKQILEGLEYLHGLNILHRDLKADNILCDHAGTCKISDFGTSKKGSDIYNNDANMSMQGSIFWMAPEVVQNFKKGYSAKADIWSLGCICLEMWAGRRPWSDEEAIQAMFKLGAERLAPPIPEDVVLTEPAIHFLNECFKIEPEQRPTASRLSRHVWVEVAADFDFLKTSLNHAIASTRRGPRRS